ncbi:MAG: tRNA lysidine(34) synthetase TilS [Methylovulum sp.]|uniref:tRNA lysidine(34) synthetase TilS n=1 Tax=Methylovulum sp. TaxID=1916980 RepID=UPI002623B814|nr:tRNA lysidine(34) synthetase TilS [Methylovulum sp.]MDD2725431.1 tRNA lysidine(34) synthetase TilS [Methylovulum sp.]MDD5124468.1 tRNA lysidine(34) synthetase TilS [Methylovulum sp.]
MLSPALVESALARGRTPPNIFIGYSGGVDSHVLLHLCASSAMLKGKTTAVYVHHGLQAEAGQWAVHCEEIAHSLDVNFQCLRVNAHPQTGESPEEAARNARYAALASLLGQDDVLLVAQHREDQLETVLLQLFRGSGLRGLSGMPERMAFGAGWLLRPLLPISKQAIDAYAQSHSLSWVEDPSNQHSDYDRNFLRNDIVPLLKQRWPALDKTVARAAAHCAEAEAVLGKLAGQLANTAINTDDSTLSISRLLGFSEVEQKLVIRHWLQHLGLKMPSQTVIGRLQTEVLAARADAAPLLSTPSYSLRRYQDKLYCLRPSSATLLTGIWPKGQQAFAINGHQRLVCLPSSRGIAKTVWQQALVEIRARQGGEKIRLPNRQGRHSLKNLYQEAGVPPWERDLMPLVYLDGQLAAVGAIWISAEFYCEEEVGCMAFWKTDNIL